MKFNLMWLQTLCVTFLILCITKTQNTMCKQLIVTLADMKKEGISVATIHKLLGNLISKRYV